MAREVDILSAQAAVARPGLLRLCIAPTLHLLGGESSGDQGFGVSWIPSVGVAALSETLIIRWNLAAILNQWPEVSEQIEDLRSATSFLLEKATEFAGYGVAICAVHALLPGRIVTHVNTHCAPDLWLSLDHDAGIEVAGRRSGGRPAVNRAVAEKKLALAERTDLNELHISVWGFDVFVGHHERVL